MTCYSLIVSIENILKNKLNMGNKQTGIEWTDYTWNPVTGCNKVSAGCANCYAEAITNRFKGTKGFPDGFALTLKPNRLNDKFGPGIKKIFVQLIMLQIQVVMLSLVF